MRSNRNSDFVVWVCKSVDANDELQFKSEVNVRCGSVMVREVINPVCELHCRSKTYRYADKKCSFECI